MSKESPDVGSTNQSVIHVRCSARIIIFAGAVGWFLTIVGLHRRNWQDAWILDGVLLPTIAFIAVSFWVVASERDLRIVALICAVFVATVSLVPGLKYVQPYGVAIDSSVHFLTVQEMLVTGTIAERHTYASIAGMHGWLATIGLLGELAPDQLMQFVLPLMGALIPLLTYWICRRAAMPEALTKRIVIVSCLGGFPWFLANGTGFSLALLLLAFGATLIQAFYSSTRALRVAHVMLAITSILLLIIWHSTTPLMLSFAMILASFSPTVIDMVQRRKLRLSPSLSIAGMGILSMAGFLLYHWLLADRVWQVMVATTVRMIQADEALVEIVPSRLFEISLMDQMRVAAVIHGRDGILLLLAAIGIVVVWRQRKVWRHQLPLYVFVFLVMYAYALMIVAAFSGAGYQRVIWAPLTLAPFFAGPALWWIETRLPGLVGERRLLRFAWAPVAGLLVGAWLVQIFACQPLIPRVGATAAYPSGDYIVWLHETNTAYQQRMLTFAQERAESDATFAIDVVGQREFLRYFGVEASESRRLYTPLKRRESINPDKVDLFLVHRPGPAGGLTEQVEVRSGAAIDALRSMAGWSTVYDNGESFVLAIR